MAAKKKSGVSTAKKVNNKQYSKLQKRGKLKKQKHKQKTNLKKHQHEQEVKENGVGQNDNEVNGMETSEEEDLDDEDLKFFSRKGRDLSFANVSIGWDEEPKNPIPKRKRKSAPADEDDTQEYEEAPRQTLGKDGSSNMKMLLPIKGERGKVIKRMLEEEAEEDEGIVEEEEEQPEEEEERKPLPPLSNVELFARRRKKLEERKEKIANLSLSILENPQQNIRRLRELREMLNEREPDLFITVRKLVMVSLMEIFKDVIPGYKIRLPTDQEKAQQLKKETRTLYEFESSLLLNYKHYLEQLEMSIKGSSQNKKNPAKGLSKEAGEKMSELACSCMCELLVHHPHFNYTTNIITVLVPLLRRGSKMSEMVTKAVTSVFKDDRAGQVTLEIVRSIGRMVKACNFHVKPSVLNTFLCLKIREVDLSTSGENRKVERRKEQLKQLSRRERKRKKAMDKINSELQEVQATEDKKKKLKMNTETIDAVFITYFRILKNATQSVLLPSVLEGLAKFAHLINIEFFDDLFKVFQQLVSSDTLTYRESLHIVQTAFTILSGQGAALNIDPMAFYRDLYNTLFKVHAGSSSEDVPTILHCLDLMISKRRKQVSQQRVLSYTKRLCTLSLHQLPHATLSLLVALRGLVQTFKYTDRLFDSECEGSGIFRPELEDPEHCNAHNTTAWELTLLQHHYHPAVRQYSYHVSRQAPSTGEGQLPVTLARMSPLELYKKHDMTTQILDNSTPQSVKSKKKKFRPAPCYHNKNLEQYIETVVKSVPDNIPLDQPMDLG